MTPEQFAAELRRVSAGAERAASLVIKKGALEVKNKARATTTSSNAGKADAASHINFDMKGTLEAEIGYDKPAGALGTMNEYGSAGNAPKGTLGKALEAQAGPTEKYLAEVIERLWR